MYNGGGGWLGEGVHRRLTFPRQRLQQAEIDGGTRRRVHILLRADAKERPEQRRSVCVFLFYLFIYFWLPHFTDVAHRPKYRATTAASLCMHYLFISILERRARWNWNILVDVFEMCYLLRDESMHESRVCHKLRHNWNSKIKKACGQRLNSFYAHKVMTVWITGGYLSYGNSSENSKRERTWNNQRLKTCLPFLAAAVY